MAHQQQHPQVPEFGNWDTDNVPYTAYFENACKGKTIKNPNDPEAFNLYMRGVENNDDDDAMKAFPRIRTYSTSSLEKISHEEGRSKSNTRRHSRQRSDSSLKAESANERSNSDYSVIHRVKSDHRKSKSLGGSFIGSFSSSHTKRKGGSHSSNDHFNHETTVIPEFGAWDVMDPKSGEGYTAIFSEKRKEKQIASRRIPSKTPSIKKCSNIPNQCGRPSSILFKCCCCLFSSESK